MSSLSRKNLLTLQGKDNASFGEKDGELVIVPIQDQSPLSPMFLSCDTDSMCTQHLPGFTLSHPEKSADIDTHRTWWTRGTTAYLKLTLPIVL